MNTFTVAFAASPRAVVSKLGVPGAVRPFGGLTIVEGLSRDAAKRLIGNAKRAKLVASIVRA